MVLSLRPPLPAVLMTPPESVSLGMWVPTRLVQGHLEASVSSPIKWANSPRPWCT